MLKKVLSHRLTIYNPCRVLNRSFYEEGLSNEPYHPIPGRFPKWADSPDTLFKNTKIEDGGHIFLHGGAATPSPLIEHFSKFAKDKGLKNLNVHHIHTEGTFPFHNPEYEGVFRSNSLFTGANCRAAINAGRADYTPIFLSEIPLLFRRKIIKLDLALIQVTPPDRHGFCSLGPSVDIARSAIQNARSIIALVNPKMPLTRGDASVHISHIDVMMHHPMELHELKSHKISDEEMKIGQIIAHNLIHDGSTLQMGIGSIPDATLSQCMDHKNLGVHTEMFSDGILPLVQSGVITNANKSLRPGKIVSSFVIGTKKAFEFLDENPFVDMCDVAWVNNPVNVARNPKVCAINSCIEIDITGQIVSDSIGSRIYSGFGGQVDFIRGAGICPDGKPIIALCSATKKGETKIVPYLHEGGGVVTTRAHVHYVVTEYGIAYLFGKNLRQRAHALINVAHPNNREALEKAAFERLKCMPSAN